LGTVLYELFAGRRAFSGDSDAEVVAAILKDRPVAITSLNPSVPAPAEWIIDRCLQKTPSDRLRPRSICCVTCELSVNTVTRPGRGDLDPQLRLGCGPEVFR
jgi:hypothetical protein